MNEFMGVSYNSYVILDEKIAVMDSVDARAAEEWLSNVTRVLEGRSPDYFIVTGVICEVILWKEGSCQKPKRLTSAWTAASLLYNGVNLLPIWFFWDTYYDFALASGMEQSYIDSYVRYYTSPGWLAFILLFTTLMGFLGCMVGSRLIRRHFKKAGVL